MKNQASFPKIRAASAVILFVPCLVIVSAIVGTSSSRSQDTAKSQDLVEILPGGVRLEMVAIAGGRFMKGSSTEPSSQPVYEVNIKPFFIAKYEVTQAQWKAVMGSLPPDLRKLGPNFMGDNLPIVCITWNEVQPFLQRMGKGYRLPSEAEWEYAAKAGSSEDYCFGNDKSLLSDYGWFSGNSHLRIRPVGQKKANAWGLYDVHGNVYEYCEDFPHDNNVDAPTNGLAWLTGGNQAFRLLKGGSVNGGAGDLRANIRSGIGANERTFHVGFRVAKDEHPR